MTQMKIQWIAAALAALLLLGLGSYFMGDDAASASAEAQNGASMEAMPVPTVTMKPESVEIWKPFSGQIVAVDRAEIRPQVSGRITEIKFKDGEHVEQGDVLLVIDPRPYKATLAQAEAALNTARTQAALAEKEYQRAKELIKTEAISQSMYDERLQNRQVAAAAVKAAKASVESAEINLDYAYVKAPISGKISRAEITEGNLVEAGANAPLLTSIVSEADVYADFEVDENTYLESVRREKSQDAVPVPVRLRLSNGTEYRGDIHSFDNRIDPTSGTIRARAIFTNKDGVLLPGMSVSVFMGDASNQEQLLLSERAIGTDQDRKFVYVIDENGQATYRQISVGTSIKGKRVILNGLEAGDVVIADGIVRIQPGMAVVAKQSDTGNDQAATPAE